MNYLEPAVDHVACSAQGSPFYIKLIILFNFELKNLSLLGVVKIKFEPNSPKKIAKFELKFGEGILLKIGYLKIRDKKETKF